MIVIVISVRVWYLMRALGFFMLDAGIKNWYLITCLFSKTRKCMKILIDNNSLEISLRDDSRRDKFLIALSIH